MIPRYQRVVYWLLVAGTLFLAVLLVRGCERNRERIAAMRDQSPVPRTHRHGHRAGARRARQRRRRLHHPRPDLPAHAPGTHPSRPRPARAHARRRRTRHPSNHPLPAGPALADVFLVALPLTTPNTQGTPVTPSTSSGDQPQAERDFSTPRSPYGLNHAPGAQLAVVNLTKTFADAHPSGIEVEDLTLRQIVATLHALLPQVEEVRFLVDGQTRDTLNGHADLTRPYSVVDPARLLHVLSPDGNPL